MSKRDAIKKSKELFNRIKPKIDLMKGFKTDLDVVLDVLSIDLVPYEISDFSDSEELYNELKDSFGFLLIEEDRPTIYVNANQSLGRRRFTIAHEVGHYYLNHQNSNILKRDPESSRGTNPQEIEANAFAAELLMPEEYFSFLYLDAGLGVQELAEEFGVSVDAATYRINNLNLKR
jgi:Zn-dependent peptidase ImmA (M78 family)